jgi:hypothetical protein
MGNTTKRQLWVRWDSRLSLTLLVGLFGTFMVSAGPALAQESKKAVGKLIDLNKDALTAIDQKQFDAARDRLLQAVSVAKQANLLTHKMLARTYVHLGAVYLVGFEDRKNACRYFGMAKTIRADIKLTPSLASANLTALFDKILSDGKDPDPSADKLPSGRRPSPHLNTAAAVDTGTSVPAGPPTVAAGVVPDLPAVLTSDLYCPVVEEATAGREIALYCAVKPGLKAERVLLYYRAPGAPSYTAAAMQSSTKGWLSASIPAEAATGESLQYYCEAQDIGDNMVATSGKAEEPNAMILKPDTGGAAVAQVQSQDKGEDPLERIKKQLINDDLERGIHRRRKGAFWFGLGAGTGYGYHLGSRLEWRRDADPVKRGWGMAGLVTGYPEIGYLLADHFGVAVQGRIEYLPTSGYGDVTSGRPAKGAYAVLARGLYYLDLGAGNAQLQFSLDAGGGDGYRFAFPPTNPDHSKKVLRADGKCETDGTGECLLKPTLLTDTIRSGPFLYGASVGFIYHFNRHIAANIEARFLGAGPHLGLLGEGYASLQFAIGGERPTFGDEPPRERLPEEDEIDEEESE